MTDLATQHKGKKTASNGIFIFLQAYSFKEKIFG